MRRAFHVGLTAAAGLALSAVAPSAHAQYCRAKACDTQLAYDDVWQTEPDLPCARDGQGCLLSGLPLYWPHSCLSFSVQKDGSPKLGIDYYTAHEVITQAFETWMSADCGGRTPSLRLDDLSPVACNQVEYNSSQGNANIFMFRDDEWPHSNSEDTLALTRVKYNAENGEIYDVDVEVNSAKAEFTLSDDPDSSANNLLAVLTHEVGHFLGLGHDPNPDATMNPQYALHERELGADDIQGVCAIYPPDQPVSTSECIPRHGFLRTCSTDESSGCAITRDATRGATASTLFVVLGLGASLRRRRRSSHRTERALRATALERAARRCG